MSQNYYLRTWICQNPTPCSNTTTQLLELGHRAPRKSIPVRAIHQNTKQPAVGVWWVWGLLGPKVHVLQINILPLTMPNAPRCNKCKLLLPSAENRTTIVLAGGSCCIQQGVWENVACRLTVHYNKVQIPSRCDVQGNFHYYYPSLARLL